MGRAPVSGVAVGFEIAIVGGFDHEAAQRFGDAGAETKAVPKAVGLQMVEQALKGGDRNVGQRFRRRDQHIQHALVVERGEGVDILLPGRVGTVRERLRGERASHGEIRRAVPQ